MRKLILLIGIMAIMSLMSETTVSAGGIIPTLESPGGSVGFYPISNELSFYKNVDDARKNRGQTLQIISINSFKLLTTFTFEFTADFNFSYSYLDPFAPELGLNDNDHYIELSLVKPITPFVSVNYQRVISTWEDESVNQFGFRLVF